MRKISFLRLVVEIRHILAAELLVLRKVVIGSVGNAFKLADAERERIFDVGARTCIVGKLIGFVRPQAKFVATKAQVYIPLVPLISPVGVPLVGFGGMAEEFDFHLLELPASEREVVAG